MSILTPVKLISSEIDRQFYIADAIGSPIFQVKTSRSPSTLNWSDKKASAGDLWRELASDAEQARVSEAIHAINAHDTMLAVLEELEESAYYWGEYDVPLGIVDRIKGALTRARGAA